jgi:hypothetical protein
MALGGGASKHLGIGNQHARNVPTAKLGPVRALYQTRSGRIRHAGLGVRESDSGLFSRSKKLTTS